MRSRRRRSPQWPPARRASCARGALPRVAASRGRPSRTRGGHSPRSTSSPPSAARARRRARRRRGGRRPPPRGAPRRRPSRSRRAGPRASDRRAPSSRSPRGRPRRPPSATSTVRRTTSPIAEKSDRGSVLPGSRASSARFATVSSPVYARNPSGIAKSRSSSQSWPGAKARPSVSVSGEKTSASPRTTISACTARSRSATASAGPCSRERRASRTTPIAAIATTPTTMSHGASRIPSSPSAAPT